MAVKRPQPTSGRPPQGEYSRLDAPLTIRMPSDLRARLSAAAERNGRSLTQEIQYRMDVSLDASGAAHRRAVQALAGFLEVAERVFQGGPERPTGDVNKALKEALK